MSKTIGHTSSGKPVYAAFQLHPSFFDWTVNDHFDAAELHQDALRTDIKTNASMHKNSAALHTEKAQQLAKAIETLGLIAKGKKPSSRRHSTRKTGAQLDREIAETLSKGTSDYALPAFYEMVKHPSDQRIWFLATEEMKKPGYKGLLVVWRLGDRKPKKAKQSSIQGLDISQGYYKRIAQDALPLEVLARFEER